MASHVPRGNHPAPRPCADDQDVANARGPAGSHAMMGTMAEQDHGAQALRRGTFGRFPLYLQILVAMALGLVTGLVLGTRASVLGQFGTILIQMIRVMAAPLLFFAIVDAFIRSEMGGCVACGSRSSAR